MSSGRSGLFVRQVLLGAVALAGIQGVGARSAVGQTKKATHPDAQVESNVLKALAAAPGLADQQISTTVVYGVVTLTGNVKDETTQSLVEDLVSRTAGVLKVVDEMVIGQAPAQPQANASAAGDESNPRLQSDGSLAPADGGQGAGPDVITQASPIVDDEAAGQNQPEPGMKQPASSLPPQQSQAAPVQRAEQPYSVQPHSAQPYPDGAAPAGPPSTYGQDQGGYAQDQGHGQPQPGYEQPQPGHGQPPSGYGQRPPQGYGPPNSQAQNAPYGSQGGAYAGQPGGVLVTIPAGAPIQIRLTQGLDSRHSQVGMRFSGVVASDVVAGGYVALPRGAVIDGTVVDVSSSGVLKGRSTLALALTQVTLGGSTFPLSSSTFALAGGDKTVRTVDSALGLGALGAIIGGVTGGGAGAAIGAGAGGATGIGASAASGSSQIFLPPEAVVSFRLTQPSQIATVSQAEMQRLSYGVPVGGPQQFRRRYPVPPPYLYGPSYFYYPRAYVYPRAYAYPRAYVYGRRPY